MIAFEKYWEEKKAYDEANKPKMMTINPSNSPIFNKSILLETIRNMDNINDSDLRLFVQNSFRSILDNIFFGSNESIEYINCFTNVRFLDAFIDVIQRLIAYGAYLDRECILKINNICYDYIIFNNTNKNPSVVDRMYMLANIINSPYLPRLLGLGLNRNIANLLLIARWSNLDPRVCVRRVNFIIITQPKSVMTQDNIVQIMKVLYDLDRDQRNYIGVFPYIMTYVIGEYNPSNPMTHWITDEVQEVNSILSLAALDILNEFTDINIRNVLVDYAESIKLATTNVFIRFSMRRLSNDYYKINNIIYNLMEFESIIVP